MGLNEKNKRIREAPLAAFEERQPAIAQVRLQVKMVTSVRKQYIKQPIHSVGTVP